ncbi:MAG: hypothetical protein Fur0010_12190 [Bdellovibrio sp.]
MDLKEVIKNPIYLTLTDGASVVAHDIAAQLHVVNFCLEELKGKLDFEGLRFYDQIKVACEQIDHELRDFRQYLKDMNAFDGPIAFGTLWQRVFIKLQVLQGKIFRRLQFVIEGRMPEDMIPPQYVAPLYFSIYSIFSEAMIEVQQEKLFVEFNVENNCVVVKLTSRWKRKWWESWPDSQDKTGVHKGMQAKLLGEKILKSLGPNFEVGQNGFLDRIPLFVRINLK